MSREPDQQFPHRRPGRGVGPDARGPGGPGTPNRFRKPAAATGGDGQTRGAQGSSAAARGSGAAEAADLTGVVERIVFSNGGNSFCVAELKSDDGQLITIRGILPGLQCGETLRVTGRWESHKQFGRQVVVERHETRLPASVQGIRKFLGSGMIPGIGKGFAERIVEKFGLDTLRILSEESGRLREVKGLGADRVRKIKEAWDEQRALREVMLFLQTYGVGVRQCMRIVGRYGAEAPTLLRSDPYRLAREVDGIGFKTADRIALNLGLASDSPSRLDAGLMHVVQQGEAAGHTALPFDTVAVEGAQLLHTPKETLERRLEHLLRQHDLASLSTLVQLPRAARDEQNTAERLLRLAAAPSGLPPIKVDAAIDWAQQRAGFQFADEQADAVAAALENKLCVITGGPGTGKTSILRALVQILQAKKQRVLLASPTGRAAQRLAESAGIEAVTLHRLLKFNGQSGGFDVGSETPLAADVVIVDEASMLDARLAAALVQGLPLEAHLILVGDADQLPSVGAGNVLADVVASGIAAVARLQRIFRQSEGSAIVHTAHGILQGDAQLPQPSDVRSIGHFLPEVAFFPADNADAARDLVVQLAQRVSREAGDPLRWQLLSPMHRGQCGIQALNPALQEALNPSAQSTLTFGDMEYRVGDKVIQTRNDYDKGVFNGDIGTVVSCDRGEGCLMVRFNDSEVPFARMELADLQLAYAISIHKSQGSEFDFVIVPLLRQHFLLLQRNLIYTALTRAKRSVLLVGEADAYRMAVQRTEATARTTTLAHRIHRLQGPAEAR